MGTTSEQSCLLLPHPIDWVPLSVMGGSPGRSLVLHIYADSLALTPNAKDAEGQWLLLFKAIRQRSNHCVCERDCVNPTEDGGEKVEGDKKLLVQLHS